MAEAFLLDSTKRRSAMTMKPVEIEWKTRLQAKLDGQCSIHEKKKAQNDFSFIP
jgi:hypothetical protein